jgi:hypothetical protein
VGAKSAPARKRARKKVVAAEAVES